MKVSELRQGMVLRLKDPNYHIWIPDQYQHWSGDSVLRFSPVSLTKLLGTRGITVPEKEMLVYLGSDRQQVPRRVQRRSGNNYETETVRRVMIGTKTCVVRGCDFKYLEPDPGFE